MNEIIFRNLPVKLTVDEQLEVAHKMSDALRSIKDLKADKEAIGKSYTSKINIAEGEAWALREKFERGFEDRQVQCHIDYDWAEGTKTIIRVDTGEVVEVLEIPEKERQMSLLQGGKVEVIEGCK